MGRWFGHAACMGPYHSAFPFKMHLKALTTHSTDWQPSIRPTINATLDASFVPSSSDGTTRLDFSHLVVLDSFINDQQRQELYDLVTSRSIEDIRSGASSSRSTWQGPTPPPETWDKATYDGTNLGSSVATWGLKHDALQALAAASSSSRAMVELQSRLCLLYPAFDIYHMPSDQMQEEGTVDANAFVVNAPVAGDTFTWHVDADPAALPEGSNWEREYGTYFNREAGKPYLVSLLVYLDREWPMDHDAETLFLDKSTDTGIIVRPKAGRVVLMDQDIIHRVSPPSLKAGRPRYSLVWKLVMIPKQEAASSLAKEGWGKPAPFGSAAKAEQLIERAAILIDELAVEFGSRIQSLAADRSVLSISLPETSGRKEALIISLPPSFPDQRPILSILPPSSDHPFTIDPGNGRLLSGCSPSLDQWSSLPRPSLVQVDREALLALMHQRGVDLESMSASEIERYLEDDEAMADLTERWLKGTQGGRAVEEIKSRNLALAEENLDMQRSIEEARNHVAIVRSSEYADVRRRFDDLVTRQEAVLEKVSPALLQKQLKSRADEADVTSGSLMDAFLTGAITPEKFILDYVKERREFHSIDLIRQSL